MGPLWGWIFLKRKKKKKEKRSHGYGKKGCFLAIGGGTAAAMAIVASAFNSNHPNYICQISVYHMRI
jgi:hypothetical protein